MTEQTTNFLGIPIEGEITRTQNRVPQKPIQFLQAELTNLLGYDSFTALKWTQHTPYFNDGDPCVFGVSVRGLLGPDEEAGDWEDGFHHPHSGYSYDYLSDDAKAFYGHYQRGTYDRATRTTSPGTWLEEPADREMVEQAAKVMNMIDSGAFNDALLGLFGDHAIVTLTRDKIEVEFYEHD